MSAEKASYGATLGWEQRACPVEWCAAKVLYVRPDPDQPDVWHVTASLHESAWLVAASAPACPLCGSTLIPIPAATVPAGAVAIEPVSAA